MKMIPGRTSALLLMASLSLLLSTTIAHAQSATVRVLFYTGQVLIKGKQVSLGQQLQKNDVVTIGRGGTLQLSINGKVLKYAKPATVKVSDAIKQAGGGENTAVANTVRTLAAASGADRGSRSSQAGATRLGSDGSDDGAQSLAEARARATAEGRTMADDALTLETGIENPIAKAEALIRDMYGEDDIVILEPRATATRSGPIRFRWLRSPSSGGYTITVKDYMGEKVFETETKDTTFLWTSPTLTPGVYYSWRLTDQRNSLHNTAASFYQLDAGTDQQVTAGIDAIRRELGGDNPAIPLVMGAYLLDNGCYGEATRSYVEGAERSPQHFAEFMARAFDVYEFILGFRAVEMKMLFR